MREMKDAWDGPEQDANNLQIHKENQWLSLVIFFTLGK